MAWNLQGSHQGQTPNSCKASQKENLTRTSYGLDLRWEPSSALTVGGGFSLGKIYKFWHLSPIWWPSSWSTLVAHRSGLAASLWSR